MAGALACMTLAPTSSQAQGDPPPGSGRLAHLQGTVSVQPNGVDSWAQAGNNMPVGAGDRVFADQDGEGELQIAQVRTYFGNNSDVTLTNLNDQGIELGVAQGSVNIYSDGFGSGQSLFVSTPNGGITVAGRANFRLDVYPDQQSTVITNFQGSPIELNGAGGFALTLGNEQSIQLTGTNPVYSQPLEVAVADPFAHWSNAIESHRFNSISARYVSAEMVGYDELDAAGEWQPESDYGPIWFPRVEAGWAPYHYGHWVNRPFYGWVWVADEPWGAAPFHYGRWVVDNGRWGWIPGPREVRPIWSPAQVVFAGGISFGGGGVAVWFPLGPGEAYRPWYPCSPEYINQINITNIHESRIIHVQTTYVNIVNVTNVTYVNRTVGVTAVRQEDFAAGHSTRNAIVTVPPAQLEHIQPSKPNIPAPAQPIILHPVSKPAAAPAARPVLINHQGQQAPAAPNARPVAVPVKAAPAPRSLPGRAPIGTPSVGGKPAPAPARTAPQPVAPAAPARTAPAAPAPVPSKPAPADRTAPPAPRTTAPAPAPAPRTVTPPPAPRPPTPEERPVKPAPAEEKPAPPAKDDKKKNDKKKPEDKKPE
jgi:hypothetical protein